MEVLRPRRLGGLFRRELRIGPGVARSGHLRALGLLRDVRQRAIHRELIVGRGAAERIDGRRRGRLGDVRQGAVAITAGGNTIGGLGVSGAPGGNLDEDCARAALAKIKERMK